MAPQATKKADGDSTARANALDFLRTMLAPRTDPYEGADLITSRRVTAALLGLSSLLGLAFLTFEPPDGALGSGGWVAAVVLLIAGLAAGALVALRSPDFDDLLLIAYAGVADVAVLNWLAGGGASAYAELFVLWLGVGAVHPPRRAFTYLAVLLVVLWLPVLYGDASGHTVTMLASESLLILAIGVVLTAYLFYVRLQRTGLRAGAEVARRLARIDALTGLGNRRALDDALIAQTAGHARDGGPLSVGLVDLDGLKRVNDRYGHLEGDRCLQEAARAMEQSVRGEDQCYRWGGDEFVVVLPGTDRPGADRVLERMAADVGRVCAGDGERGLTLSYGVAELPPDGSAEDLLALADLALMERKTEKRR